MQYIINNDEAWINYYRILAITSFFHKQSRWIYFGSFGSIHFDFGWSVKIHKVNDISWETQTNQNIVEHLNLNFGIATRESRSREVSMSSRWKHQLIQKKGSVRGKNTIYILIFSILYINLLLPPSLKICYTLTRNGF